VIASGISQLDRAWAVLTRPSTDQLASFPLDLAFEDVACRVALDRNGFRHLLIASFDEQPEVDSRPSVLSATLRPLSFGGKVHDYFDIACLDQELHPEFDEVVLDILETIQGADQPAVAAAESLARWRRLFRSRLVRGLSMEARIGLFAELSVLIALTEADSALPIEMWRGPLREPHDFELKSRCIEVKGLAERSERFTVHGWEQLDRHDERPLDLILVNVVSDPTGLSISNLVETLRKRVESPTTLRARLLAAGWDETIATADDETFTVGTIFGLPVSDAVPRLVRNMLVQGQPPDGVSGLRYQVELADLLPMVVETSLALLTESAVQ
jgi:hypothetical protein